MNATEVALEIGREYRFEESDGGAQRVKLLEKELKDGRLTVKLEILANLQSDPIRCLKVGRILEVDKVVNAEDYCFIWELTPI